MRSGCGRSQRRPRAPPSDGRLDERLRRSRGLPIRDGQERLPDLDLERTCRHADILRRVEVSSALGGWSYEPVDTKLARETKAGTILQLCLYADLKRAFLMAMAAPATDDTYPDPIEHCDICRWREACDGRRHDDDHLCLVAGISKIQIHELKARDIATVLGLAGMRVPLEWKRRPLFARRLSHTSLSSEVFLHCHGPPVGSLDRREMPTALERLHLAVGEEIIQAVGPAQRETWVKLRP